MSKKILIVGGVAGGASTAARLRRVDEDSEIVLFERGEYISFANCGLPYYIGGTIEQRDALLVQTPENMERRFNIDVRVQNEVLSINREDKTVTVKNLKDGQEYTESYDKLILSPGSTPLKPPIPGIDGKDIFTLWTIPDTDTIKSFIDDHQPKKAVVVGGGFIGIEMAENLYDQGIDVSIIEMQDQVMGPVDFEMAQEIHKHIKSKGVNLILEDGVSKFEDYQGKKKITLQSGKEIVADMVMLSIGVRPNSELAKEAGLTTNKRGGIVVDDYLRTDDKDIYALGDAIEVTDFVSGEKTMIPLAGPANKQGRIVANNIVGKEEKYKGTQGTSIAKVFDLTVANTGNNEKTLNSNGKQRHEDYHISIIHSKSNAGYYPGAIPMTIKTIFDNDGKILGAQIVGYNGVDKRIDVLATAIRAEMTVYDLKELELAYAPPYSSAKDPVNMVGFVGENMLEGTVKQFNVDEFDKIDDSYTILDIREAIELDLGKISGSVHIPLHELRERLDELSKDQKIIVYCAVGVRGYIAARILMQHGFEQVYNLNGGYNTYSCYHCQDDGEMCGGVSCSADMDFSETGDVEMAEEITPDTDHMVELNACGLSCPGPIMQVYKKMETMDDGEVLKARATDPGFTTDIKAWSNKTGNTLLEAKKEGNEFVAIIMKGKKGKKVAKTDSNTVAEIPNNKTLVMFSDDLDKTIAGLIIANGSASMGRKVTMFFTFWGLNILRKENHPKVKKNFIGKMFGKMMPKGTKKLKLSKLNMFGAGSKMIRGLMKKHNVGSVEDLLKQAIDSGVEVIACQMSMDLMGIKEKELIDGVTVGGVASYLGETEDADTNLFI